MAEINEQEKLAADLLTNEGVSIVIGKRTYKIKELTLGMMDSITSIRLKMKVNEDGLKSNPIAESNQLVHFNAGLAAQIVAIAILGRGSFKRRLLTKRLGRRLMESLTSATLYEAVIAIIKLSNVGDFTNSIRLAAGIRMTSPAQDPNQIETE